MSATLTADDLLHLRLPHKRTELVRGRLVVREPAGYRHGVIAARIAHLLVDFVEARGLGQVVGAETGFTVGRDPDTVRAPDAAFIARERLPSPTPRGFAELAPDLVVEVLSPDDRPGDVLGKVGEWLSAGSRLVWVVDAERGEARVYRADGTQAVVGPGEGLEGEDVLPGLAIPLSALL